MGEWISTTNGLIALITGLIGLVGTAVGAFISIKTFIKSLKNKNFTEVWNLIMSIADTAMKEAEISKASGVDKKTMVIDTVKNTCLASGIDISAFLDQLNIYIDDSIKFVNDMSKQIQITIKPNTKKVINEKKV